MKFAAILAPAFLVGCSAKNTIKAEGTATVRHVVTIEFGVCDTIEDPAAKVECVKTLLDILAEAIKKEGDNGE